MEVPIVSFGVGGIMEYLRPYDSQNISTFTEANGILVDEVSPEALADACSILLKDESLRLSFGKNGRELVSSHLTSHHQNKAYITLYESLPMRSMLSDGGN